MFYVLVNVIICQMQTTEISFLRINKVILYCIIQTLFQCYTVTVLCHITLFVTV